MPFYIPFHSRYFQKKFSDHENRKILWNGESWSHLWVYDFHTDSKHIFWKKSTNPHQIFQKKYEIDAKISLIFCFIHSEGDDFEENDNFPSREKWKQNSDKTLANIAKYMKIPYKILHFTDHKSCFQTLLNQKTQKNLIFIFSNISAEESYSLLKKISIMNEVIWIHCYHNFEKNPHSLELFEGKIFSQKKKQQYLQLLDEQEKREKSLLKSLKIPFLSTQTSIPIEKTLYHFFKYQYE